MRFLPPPPPGGDSLANCISIKNEPQKFSRLVINSLILGASHDDIVKTADHQRGSLLLISALEFKGLHH